MVGFEIIPLTQLRHPRINTFVRVSGLFRDTCSIVLSRLQQMFNAIALLDNETANSLA